MSTYCPSCQDRVVKNADGTCPTCGWTFSSARSNAASAGATGVTVHPIALRAPTRPKIPVDLHVAFVVDRTGSSERFKRGIPKTAEIILTQAQLRVRSLHVSLQSHGDRDCDEHEVLHVERGDAETALNEIRRLVFAGGGDDEETHLDAIQQAVETLPWSTESPRSRGAIVAILNAESKPLTSGLSISELAQQIKRCGLLVYLVCQPTDRLRELAVASGGLMFEISNTPAPERLAQIAAQLGASIVQSVARGDTVAMPISAA